MHEECEVGAPVEVTLHHYAEKTVLLLFFEARRTSARERTTLVVTKATIRTAIMAIAPPTIRMVSSPAPNSVVMNSSMVAAQKRKLIILRITMMPRNIQIPAPTSPLMVQG